MQTKTLILSIVSSAVLSSAGTALILSPEKNKSDINTPLNIEKPINPSLELRVSALERQLKNTPGPLNQIAEEQATTPAISDSETIDNNEVDEPDFVASFAEERRRMRTQFFEQSQPEYRAKQLVSAGFAQEEAARILQLEQELALEQLNEQYQLRRERLKDEGNSLASTNLIRAELGDENYERYLEANGLPTSARVNTVIGGSPAQNAGLRAGDKILSYAGTRVFNFRDVTFLTAKGAVGENVLIEVERSGERVQLTIPRGPIGVTSR